MKILITEPLDFSNENLKLLKEVAEVKIGPFTRMELIKEIEDMEVLILRLNHFIDREVFLKADNLQYILTPTTGLNHIDLEEAAARNIEIISLIGETEFLATIPSTGEHTWALLLSLLRKIPQGFDHVKKGGWERDQFKAHNLCHYTLGLLGFGRVGKQIAEYAKVFKMPFVFYDINPELRDHPNACNSLEELLKKIDILSIHIPLNDQNSQFLNGSNLTHLKRGTYIVNTSRGELIDEDYIAEALKAKELGGYATDVLANEIIREKRKENPLMKIAATVDNLIITPHIAGATYESMWKTEEFVIRKWLKNLDTSNNTWPKMR
ncbi:NAD(P)-dependent oxidoreductase [Antarcticibacterium arcticum]|nr:NAD(P)-dependent oxidoreductase [Antarcticibacterium arcticum]